MSNDLNFAVSCLQRICGQLLVAGIITSFAMLGGIGESNAGGKRVYFKHSSTSSSKSMVQHKSSNYRAQPVVRHHQRQKNYRRHYSTSGHYKTPTGPLVIDVHKVLKRRKLKITTHHPNIDNNINRHVIDNGFGGKRVLYYDDAQCEGGFDCVIRLGNASSSPKIIVIGEKRGEQNGTIIIYPPS